MNTTLEPLQATLSSPDLDALARSRLLLLDSLKEGIFRIDEQGLCVFMNRAAGSMLGYGLGEARGKPIQELHHPCLGCVQGPLLAPPTNCPLHGAPNEVGHLDRRGVFRRCDGTSFPVEWSFHPLCEGGVYHGAMINFSDITARLNDERHLRLQCDVSRILGGAASVEAAAPEILKSICETLDLDYAWFWEIGQPATNPALVDSWRRSAESPPLVADPDLARKIALSGAPLWISGSNQDVSSAGPALRPGFAVPLCLGSRVIGAMEFIRRKACAEDPDIFKTMLLLGDAIAQFVVRRRAEQARGWLIAILEATTAFVGVAIDLEGKILSVNKAVEQIFGYLPEELLGQSLSRLIPAYQRHLRESNRINGPGTGELAPRIRAAGVHKSGRPVLVELSLGECAENGRRVMTFIIADTTQHDAAEEALRNQTRLVQLIVSSMGDGVVVADENFEVLVVNPAAHRLIPPVRGAKSLLDTRHMLDGSEPLAYFSDGVTRYWWNDLPLVRAIRGESVDSAELLLRPPDSTEEVWLSETARPLLDNTGRLCGGVVISRDITDQKASADALHRAKDQAESANRAKSEFLSRMSHELRTPMNAILGFAQLLELDPLSAEQKDGVTRMLKAGRHLLGLINEILDLSRIEAGRLSLKMDRVDAYDLMHAAVDLVRPLMEQRNIRLVEPSPDCAGCYVNGDPQRLMQVFLNLLSNAVKYNRESGSVTISFSRHQFPLEGLAALGSPGAGRLRVSVADTGAGIASGDLKKLFVPFERLTADRTAIEGTGLGLALSQHLIHLMHGSMGVKSTVGEGSIFWADMTLSEVQVGSSSVRAGLTSESADDQHVSSILYIDDNLVNAGQIEAMLSKIPGFQLICAREGRSGLEMAREHIPRLILLGVTLPDIHPLDALRQLQGNEETGLIPVVVVSAEATEGARNELIEAGARAYIAMPIGLRGFLDVITEIISHDLAA